MSYIPSDTTTLHRLSQGGLISAANDKENWTRVEGGYEAVNGRGVITGFTLSAGTGLQVKAAAGSAMLACLVETSDYLYSALSPSTTTYVWLKNSGSSLSLSTTSTSTPPAGVVCLLGTATTDGSGVTGTDQSGEWKAMRVESNTQVVIGPNSLNVDTHQVRVGVGTGSPTDELHVAGTARMNYGKFPEQSSMPTSASNYGFLFTLDVDGISELAFMDDGGRITQLTQRGGKRQMQVLANPGGTTATVVGTAAPTLTATATNADDSDGPWIQHDTSAVSGTGSGLISAFTVCRRDWSPEGTFTVKTPATVTSLRHWVGFFSASPDASATPSIHLAGFRYDTAADGTAFWRCVTDNGSGSPTVTATTVAYSASTKYVLRVVLSGSDVKFYINGALVAAHTTTLPTATTLLGYGVRVTNLTAASRFISWGRVALAHN